MSTLLLSSNIEELRFHICHNRLFTKINFCVCTIITARVTLLLGHLLIVAFFNGIHKLRNYTKQAGLRQRVSFLNQGLVSIDAGTPRPCVGRREHYQRFNRLQKVWTSASGFSALSSHLQSKEYVPSSDCTMYILFYFVNVGSSICKNGTTQIGAHSRHFNLVF